MSAEETLAESLRETDYDWSKEFGEDAYLARARKTLGDLRSAGYTIVALPEQNPNRYWDDGHPEPEWQTWVSHRKSSALSLSSTNATGTAS